MLYGIFEVAMLLCFAAAWPLSISKAWKSRTAKGTSLGFMLILEVGYVFGMINKVVNDDINYVLFFYIFNFVLVGINVAIVLRNRRLDRLAETSS